MMKQLNPEQSFFIMSVINSMPAAWRLLIRTANIAPMLSPLPNTPAILINDILIPILDTFGKFKAHLSVFSGEKNKLHLPLKRSTPARRVCGGREKKIIFSVSPQSHSLFSASFQTFCLTAHAYLSRQKYGLFCSRVKSLPFIYVEP